MRPTIACSLLALTILAFGLAGPQPAQAQTAAPPAATPPAPSAPAAPAPPVGDPITAKQLDALAQIALAASGETVISEATGVGLGLTEPGSTYRARQISFQAQGARYSLAVHVSGNGPLLFMRTVGLNASMWVCDREAKLIKAANVTEALIEVADINNKELREAFDAALRLWSERVPISALNEIDKNKPTGPLL